MVFASTKRGYMEYIDYGLDDDMDDLVSACWDEYCAQLKIFWERNKPINKDWEDLNWYEQDQVKRDYEMEEERLNNPERFYGTCR